MHVCLVLSKIQWRGAMSLFSFFFEFPLTEALKKITGYSLVFYQRGNPPPPSPTKQKKHCKRWKKEKFVFIKSGSHHFCVFSSCLEKTSNGFVLKEFHFEFVQQIIVLTYEILSWHTIISPLHTTIAKH